MTPAGGDGAYVLKSGRDIELPVVVGAPGGDRAVGQQGKAVVAAGCDGCDRGTEYRCGGLPGRIASPTGDMSVGVEGQ